MSELDDVRPSKVRELVPGASAVQIATFLQLAEDAAGGQKRRRQEAAGLLEEREISNEREPVSPVGSVKELSVEDAKIASKMKCQTDVKSEFIKRLKRLIPPEGFN